MTDISRLAGGDDFELAQLEIRYAFRDARERLATQHPFFFEEQECADSSPAS